MRPIRGGKIERKYFTTADIIKRFDEIGRHISAEIEGYMVGGGAMSLRGDKEVTKDVDLLFAKDYEAQVFYRGALEEGFSPQIELENAYANMRTFAVLKDPSMFWIDMFLKRICGRFYLSDTARNRAEVWGSFDKFTLLLFSREDIFLSKSITERDRDLDDMETLLRKGIDSKAILDECNVQSLNSDHVWHLSLETKLEELETKYDFTVPWKSELREVGGRVLLGKMVPGLLAERPATVKVIAQEFDVDERTTREVLQELETEGKVEVDRRKRPFVYSLVSPGFH